MINDRTIVTEIPPISVDDTFVIFERRKKSFDFPIHTHSECEITLIQGADGAQRTVGDTIQEIHGDDLVLIGGGHLEHCWKDGNMSPDSDIYEVTIQFSADLFKGSGLFDRRHFTPIRRMFKDAKYGLAFSQKTIGECKVIIEQILRSSNNFNSVLLFLTLLNTMAQDEHYHMLSNPNFSTSENTYEAGRINDVMAYINAHYSERISLGEIAAVANMSVPSFSRFIKKCTGHNFVDVLNNCRLGVASRMLIDNSDDNISSIAFKCGFNNLSNFNRIFKKKKGMTPHEFKLYYAKNKIII